MAYTGYKIYRNRRRTVLINGVTESSLTLTEPNLNGVGLGPYFPPVLDLTSCTSSNCDPILGSVVYYEPPASFMIQSTNLKSISNITINSSSTFSISWGDGNTDSFSSGNNTNIGHTYSNPIGFSGNIELQMSDLSQLDYFDSGINGVDGSVVIQGSEISKLTNLNWFVIREGWTLNCDVSDLPDTIQTINAYNASVTGDLSNLPTSLVSLYLYDGNSMTGTISDLFSRCPNLTTVEISGSNTISGDIKDINPNLINISIYGQNTISGTLSMIPGTSSNSNLEILQILGYNTIQGDLSYINWPNILYFQIGGREDHSGGISTLSNITGNLNDITWNPNIKVFGLVNGLNTVSGNIDTNPFPSNIEVINIRGESIISATYGNTIAGNISNLPHTNIKQISIFGKNLLTGSLSSYNSQPSPNLEIFEISGLNTISGDLKDVPDNVNVFNLYGQNSVSNYTPPTPKVWGNYEMKIFKYNSFSPGFLGITESSEYSQLLIDLDGSTWSNYDVTHRRVELSKLSSVVPTISGSASYTSLETKLGGPSYLTVNNY